ncbi:MAG TPA: GNAT family N-acetyltransferase [Blastocatellia bacterium]|nr:GNAT family N-acetyltransferase [Blastocatellia bacterium]
MLTIRRASLQDKSHIRAIYLSATGGQAIPGDTYLDGLISKGGVFVAERDGEVIGFGGVDLEAAEQIKYLYILPKHHKGGIGSKILTRLEVAGWEAGLETLRLHSSPAAVGFYSRKGYKAVAEAEQAGHDHEGVEMIKVKG